MIISLQELSSIISRFSIEMSAKIQYYYELCKFFLVFVVNQGQNGVRFVVNQGQNGVRFVVNQGQNSVLFVENQGQDDEIGYSIIMCFCSKSHVFCEIWRKNLCFLK